MILALANHSKYIDSIQLGIGKDKENNDPYSPYFLDKASTTMFSFPFL
jgi:hypothetical protein